MNFLNLAINNLKRGKIRSILTILSVMVAAATINLVISLDSGYNFAVNEELVKKTGVHIYISKEGCPMEAASVIVQGGLSPLYVPENITDKIKNVDFIESIMPFKIFAIATSDGSRTDIFMGITDAIKKIRADWEIIKGGWFENENSIILGAEIARLEKREIGDKVYFEQFDKEFVVSGILKRNNTQDDGIFFLPLEVAQKLTDRAGKLSAIAIKLKDISNLEDTRNIIRSMLPQEYYVITSKELSAGVLDFFGATRAIMFVMVIIAFIVAGFGIANTMFMAIIERKKEIAYFKCVGARFSDIIKIISIEAIIIGVAGSFLGLIIGIIIVPWFEIFVRNFLVVYVPSSPIVRLNIGIILFSSVIVVVVGVLASLYPAIKAAKIVPMEVLRDE